MAAGENGSLLPPEKVTELQELVDQVLKLQHGDQRQLAHKQRALFGAISSAPFIYNWDRLWLQHLIEQGLDEAGLQANPCKINVAQLVNVELSKRRHSKPPTN